MDAPPTPDIASLAAGLAQILDHLLALVVVLAIAGGSLFVLLVLLFFRVSSLEQRITDRIDGSAASVVRKVNGRISDMDLVTPETQASPAPTRTGPRSRRRS